MATAIWAAAAAVTTTDGAEAVVIITDGPGAAVTTSTATTDKHSLDSLSSSHCPGDTRIAAAGTGRAQGRGRFSLPDADVAQPSPISTAIRMRSE